MEGQGHGVHQMVENARYCVDILHQVSVIQLAMNKVSLALLEDSTHHCVAKAIKENKGEEAISELMDVMKTMTK
jgi:DNA-binding FrmR family transcriptional regulator